MLVEEVQIHEDYIPSGSGSMQNDIALLFLYHSFEPSIGINTICLPTPNLKIRDDRCIVSGWGRTSRKNQTSKVLRKVEVPIRSRPFCANKTRTHLNPDYKLHRSFLCAGGMKNKNACKGDDGSPLICPLEGQDVWVQVGIFSWELTTKCGLAGVPGIYVNVPYFITWITEELEYRNLTDESFTYSK